MVVIKLIPSQIQENGQARKCSDQDAFALLAETATRHRMKLAAADRHDALKAIVDGRYDREDGELVATISEQDLEIPSHLVGRLRDGDGEVIN